MDRKPISKVRMFAKTTEMKKILFAMLATVIFSLARAQVLTTKITKGYNGFSIDNVKFPLNSLLVNIRSSDTSMVELDLVHEVGNLNSVYITVKKRVNYINGTTGVPFRSIGELRGYCDSFLYSH